MRHHHLPVNSGVEGEKRITLNQSHSTQVQRIPLDHAVFDLHFSPRDPSLFAIALSTSAVALYRIETADEGPRIQYVNTIPVHEDPSQLSLFLAWIPPNLEHDVEPAPDGFAVSFSGGQISVFHTNTPAEELTRDSMSEIEFTGSPIEVWYVAFDSTKPAGNGLPSLLSGDDFSQVREFVFPGKLVAGDEDEDEDAVSPYQKFNDRGRHHDSGVTAILPISGGDAGTVLITGGYDGHIRVYRLAMRGQVLTELDLGGGVWRLKLITTTAKAPPVSNQGCVEGRDYYILASCMHGGTRVVKLSRNPSNADGDGQWSFEVLAEFTEHESMNYASDFRIKENTGLDDIQLLCVSSSFYDKRVCVWNAAI